MKNFPGGFAVLMAVYSQDSANLFTKAVESCFENSLLPDQFVLVVDGPLPKLLDQAIEDCERRYAIRLVRLPENRGLAEALNAGLKHVTTEWVLRADADDINLPERFALQAQAARSKREPDLMGGAILEVEADGSATAVRRPPSDHHAIRCFARMRNPFNHMTVAFRLSSVLNCGGYPNIRLKEDYALWALMLKNGASTLNVPEVVVHATTGRDMYSRRGGWRYARDELLLQVHLHRCGLKGRMAACLHGVGRGGVFLLPVKLRGFFYLRFLRSREHLTLT